MVRLSVRLNIFVGLVLLTWLLCKVSMLEIPVRLNTLSVRLMLLPPRHRVARRVMSGTLHLSIARVTCVANAWLDDPLALQAMETKLGLNFRRLLNALQTAFIGEACPGGNILSENTGERTVAAPPSMPCSTRLVRYV